VNPEPVTGVVLPIEMITYSQSVEVLLASVGVMVEVEVNAPLVGDPVGVPGACVSAFQQAVTPVVCVLPV
jgi:hypothetical protein